MSEFTPGSRYIHFTKYGGVNKGEVEWYGTQINWDTDNKVAYHIPYIKSTKGIIIHLNGEDGRVYKIKDDITEDMLIKLKSSSFIFEELKKRKEMILKVERTKEMIKNSNIEEVLKKYENDK